MNTDKWNEIFNNTAQQVWPMLTSFIIPLIIIIIAFLFAFAVGKAVMNYHQGGEIQIRPIVVMIAGIALLLALNAGNGALLKSLLGLSF